MAFLFRSFAMMLLLTGSVLRPDNAGADPTASSAPTVPSAQVARPTPSAHLTPTPSTDSGSASRLAQAQATLRGEPSFKVLKDAALRLADADTARTSGLGARARTQAILPILKFTADMDYERDESLDQELYEPDQWGADTDRDLGFQISAQWHLSELIFNPDLLRVYSTLSSRASDREELISLLAGYYFERRRLILISAAVPEPDIRKAIEVKMRIEELTAVIDALTGGRLSRNLSDEDRSETTDRTTRR